MFLRFNSYHFFALALLPGIAEVIVDLASGSLLREPFTVVQQLVDDVADEVSRQQVQFLSIPYYAIKAVVSRK